MKVIKIKCECGQESLYDAEKEFTEIRNNRDNFRLKCGHFVALGRPSTFDDGEHIDIPVRFCHSGEVGDK